MNSNRHQAKWIFAQGWVKEDILHSALTRSKSLETGDLCDLLVQHGLISPQQAHVVREQTRSVVEAPIQPVAAPFVETSSSEYGMDPGIPGFRVDKVLGKGAMGVVYSGLQLDTGKIAAIKVSTVDHMLVEKRFSREIKVLKQIRHQNIVQFVATGATRAGQTFLAMEFIKGEDYEQRILGQLRTSGAIHDWQQVLLHFHAIADALKYCHEQDVIHRDLKPANLLIETDTNRVLLTDFGLVKSAREAGLGESMEEALTKSQDMIGTPAFMAPEQILPNKRYGNVCPQTDVWGFAATMFFCMTGRLPFEAESTVGILQKILRDKPMSVSNLNPDFPSWLDGFFKKCFVKETEKRWSMAEVAALMKRELGISDDQSHSDSASSASVPRLQEPAESSDKKLQLILITAIIIGLGAISALLFTLMRSPSVLSVTTEDPIVSSKQVTITGTTSAPVEVLINDTVVSTDESNKFSGVVKIQEGLNKIQVQVAGNKDKSKIKVVVVTGDFLAPEFTLFAPKLSKYHLITGDVIEGKVEDDRPSEFVEINDQRVKLDKDNRFAFKLRAGDDKVSVKASDTVGNTTSLSFPIIRKSAFYRKNRTADIKFFGNLVKPALNYEDWRITPDKKKIEVAKYFETIMKPEFTFVGLETYNCFDKSLEVAVFKHVLTGSRFSLIPGGPFEPASQHLMFRIVTMENPERGIPYLVQLTDDRFLAAWVSGIGLTPAKSRTKLESQVLGNPKPIIALFKRIIGQQYNTGGRFDDQIYKAAVAKFHQNVIIWPYLISQTEVSRLQWRRFISNKHDIPKKQTDSLPQTSLSYALIEKKLRQHGGTIRIPMRWETQYPIWRNHRSSYVWGDNKSQCQAFAWTAENSGSRIHEVDSEKNTSVFGLLHQHGNAMEMIAFYSQGMLTESKNIEILTGSYTTPVECCTVEVSTLIDETYGDPQVGFRFAAPLPGFVQFQFESTSRFKDIK